MAIIKEKIRIDKFRQQIEINNELERQRELAEEYEKEFLLYNLGEIYYENNRN